MSEHLTFVRPLIGLERFEQFELAPVEGAAGLYALRSNEGLRLFVLDADVHLPDYRPEFSEEQLEQLGLDTSAAEVAAQLLVVISPAAARSTVNLAAPIVVNPATGAAGQFVLDGDEWPLRHALAA